MTVLIITRSDDNECIESVTREVTQRGGRTMRFDTDEFPTAVRAVIRCGPGGEHVRFITRDGEHDLAEVTAVWYRRTRFGAGIPETLDRQLRRGALEESQATALGLIASVPVFHLDPHPLVRAAGHKQLQLRVAREVGLQIPDTLITNDPAAVREFAAAHPQGIVAKMLSSFHVLEGGKEKVVFTNVVPPAALEDLSGLQLAPMTFQENVPKKLELRITIVGTQAFTAAIDSQSHAGAREDWRREGNQLVGAWTHWRLPEDVAIRLLRLMDRFGLNYGAIDMIVTPDDRLVFLELNPVGEYFWLEHAPGLPISAAIADVLMDRAPRRRPALA